MERRVASGRRLASSAGIAAAIVALSWPYTLAAPVGIDESWRAALHLTGPSGLHFGEDIVFTYGPLGFLSVPAPFFGASSILAIVATAGVYLAAAATLLVLASRLLPGWAAVAVVLVTARAVFPVLPPFEMLQALVFVWCVEAVLAERIRVRAEWLIVGAGIVAAVALMGKTNVGVFASGMLLVAAVALGRPWWRERGDLRGRRRGWLPRHLARDRAAARGAAAVRHRFHRDCSRLLRGDGRRHPPDAALGLRRLRHRGRDPRLARLAGDARPAALGSPGAARPRRDHRLRRVEDGFHPELHVLRDGDGARRALPAREPVAARCGGPAAAGRLPPARSPPCSSP